MISFISRTMSRATLVAALITAGAGGVMFTASSGPALALCKYGTPHCVNPHRVTLPTVNTTKFPDSGWVDPDCKYYGNCLPDNQEPQT
jgi:hypothetical protein